MISTRDLSELPDIPHLKCLCQSLAMLDVILEPDWQMRYYSFNAHWGVGKEMTSMRDGEGNGYFLVFSPAGAILKGFAHESAMIPYRNTPPQVWSGVLDEVPKEFTLFLTEPAFTPTDTTFCIWRRTADTAWQRGGINFPEGSDPDGSAELLAVLDGVPKTYQQWAQDYYERPIPLSPIKSIYEHRPLSPALIKELNSDADWESVLADAREIGCPLSDSTPVI